MKYSVWNNATRAYDYYEAPGDDRIHAGPPPTRSTSSELGATPEQAAWPLPSDARRIGAGEHPQGRIASTLGDDGNIFSIDLTKTLLYAAAGYLIWRMTR